MAEGRATKALRLRQRRNGEGSGTGTVESTLLFISVNYREMILCILSTWRIVRSRSKYKLYNRLKVR